LYFQRCDCYLSDDTPTIIDVNGSSVSVYGSEVSVKKNGITIDTTVTCAYYTEGKDCDYSKANVFIQYTHEVNGTSVSESTVLSPTYYAQHQNIMFEGSTHMKLPEACWYHDG
jgi:hypothetical protein